MFRLMLNELCNGFILEELKVVIIFKKGQQRVIIQVCKVGLDSSSFSAFIGVGTVGLNENNKKNILTLLA